MERVIRVFVVDEHPAVRLGLRAFLDAVPDLRLVGEAAGGRGALDRLARLAEHRQLPDVVIMDPDIRDMDGVAITAAIRARYPDVEVVALAGFGATPRVHAALEAGAAGYVLKDADVDEIVHAVRAVHRGDGHLNPAVPRTSGASRSTERAGTRALTARERDVLVLVAQGRSNREIARTLSIGERTVQTHLSNVLAKLELASRTQAALWAVREGLAELWTAPATGPSTPGTAPRPASR